MIFALLPTAACKLASTEMAFEKLAATLQVPGIFSLASANGPTNAMVPVFFIGSTFPWFFSNTKLWVAISRAVARLAAEGRSQVGRELQGREVRAVHEFALDGSQQGHELG